MANLTAIEWTDATWNPVTGCTKISAGCDHCYAERFSERFRGTPDHPFESGFDLTLRPERIEQPLRWRQPRMIFVNSMSDLFHKEIPTEFITQVLDTMERADWHTFQVLTKRSSLMRDFLRRRYGEGRGPAHMWFACPSRTAVGKVEFGIWKMLLLEFGFFGGATDWISGRTQSRWDLLGYCWRRKRSGCAAHETRMGARSARSMPRQRCSFFFKQWAGLRPKSGGRKLDGREWNQFPKVSALDAVAAE